MRKRIQFLLILGVLFTSCSTVAHLQTDDTVQKYPATNYKEIEVYSTDKTSKDFVVIGEVIASADAGKYSAISLRFLKKEAAKMGADGIINLRLEIEYGYWAKGIKASGIAVKFTN
jgi:uncharacterized protein YbjQ (UPF0145 family)